MALLLLACVMSGRLVPAVLGRGGDFAPLAWPATAGTAVAPLGMPSPLLAEDRGRGLSAIFFHSILIVSVMSLGCVTHSEAVPRPGAGSYPWTVVYLSWMGGGITLPKLVARERRSAALCGVGGGVRPGWRVHQGVPARPAPGSTGQAGARVHGQAGAQVHRSLWRPGWSVTVLVRAPCPRPSGEGPAPHPQPARMGPRAPGQAAGSSSPTQQPVSQAQTEAPQVLGPAWGCLPESSLWGVGPCRLTAGE